MNYDTTEYPFSAKTSLSFSPNNEIDLSDLRIELFTQSLNVPILSLVNKLVRFS